MHNHIFTKAIIITLMTCAGYGWSFAPIQNEMAIPDYRAWAIRSYDHWYNNYLFNSRKPAWERLKTPPGHYEALMIYKATGDKKYLEIGVKIFERNIKEIEASKLQNPLALFGDFGTYPLFASADILKQKGKLAQEWENTLTGPLDTLRKELLHRIRERNDSQKFEFRWGNRELARMAGYVYAVFELFKDDPAFETERQRILHSWKKDLIPKGYLDESSGNYSPLGLYLLIKIAEAMGCENDLRSEKWRNQFAIYRDLVSPSGQMPEWGDDYFDQGGSEKWLYCFEYAATLYNDPTFAWAARRLFQRQERYFLERRHRHNRLGGIYDFLDDDFKFLPTGTPEPLTGKYSVSLVNYRHDNLGRECPSAMIMRPDMTPGSPMIAFDLYGLGDHAHMNKRASINYYENNNVPLFHAFTRHHGRDPGGGGNCLYMQPESNNFPRRKFESGSWYKVSIPYDRITVDKENHDLRLIKGFHTFPGLNKTQAVFIDNLRLEGPSGIKAIDDFEEEIDYYKNQRGVDYARLPGSGTAIQFTGNGRISIKDYGVKFSDKDYKVFSYDVMYKGDKANIFFRYSYDYPNMYTMWHASLDNSPFYSVIENARTKMKGKDAYGEIEFSGYGSWDTPYRRQIVLTKEGIIIARDTFTAGDNVENWSAGIVWQFYNISVKGENYFASELMDCYAANPADKKLYKQGKLVYFVKSPGDAYGLHEYEGGSRATAYSKFKIQAGENYERTTIVIPFGVDDDVKTLADSIHAESTKGKSRVTIGRITVIIGKDAEFDVIRNVKND